jgi:hypothetical protein
VDDELHLAPRERGDVDGVAGLPQPVHRVHHVELLGGVAGEHENSLHVFLPRTVSARGYHRVKDSARS